jgi:transcriptional regulator with XRE-family HTH domain
MTNDQQPAWDGRNGLAGGPAFGAALAALAAEREISDGRLAGATGIPLERLAAVLAGSERIGVAALARLAQALRARPIEFLQRTGILSLDVYAFGLDPLYFLAEGPTRYEARIYMREINPRHRVPEGDMTKRNPVLAAVVADDLLDALGKVEIELAYLLRVAVQQTGGTL